MKVGNYRILPHKSGVLRVANTKPKKPRGKPDAPYSPGYVRVYRDDIKIAEIEVNKYNPLEFVRKSPDGFIAKTLIAQLEYADCTEHEIDFVMETERYKEWLAWDEKRRADGNYHWRVRGIMQDADFCFGDSAD